MSGTAAVASAPASVQSIRAAILANSTPVMIPHDSGTQNFSLPGTTNALQVSIKPRYTGLLRGFTLRIQMSITAASAMTRTNLGAANLLSQFTLIDLNSIQRIQTSGRHLHVITSAKRKKRTNSVNLTDSPSGWNAGAVLGGAGNWGSLVENCPATIAAGATVNLVMTYEIPVAYAYNDLRGSIYLNTVQAQLTLQAVINNVGAFVAANADTLNAVYTCAGALPTVNSVTVDGLQDYLDQLPIVKGANGNTILLPVTDMGQLYQMTEQTYAASLTVGADYPISYGDARQFLSTLVTFDNGGQYNFGTDVNTFKLQSAGMFNYWLKKPAEVIKHTRDMLSSDLPGGMYYFNSRNHPITTTEYGNTRLQVNPSIVNAGATLIVGLEYFGTAATVAGSGVSGTG